MEAGLSVLCKRLFLPRMLERFGVLTGPWPAVSEAPNRGCNLGYPVEVGSHPCWGLDVVEGCDRDGVARVIPIVFDESQAREVARRIVAFYGPDPAP